MKKIIGIVLVLVLSVMMSFTPKSKSLEAKGLGERYSCRCFTCSCGWSGYAPSRLCLCTKNVSHFVRCQDLFILDNSPLLAKDIPTGWNCKCSSCAKTFDCDTPTYTCSYCSGSCICVRKAPIRLLATVK